MSDEAKLVKRVGACFETILPKAIEPHKDAIAGIVAKVCIACDVVLPQIMLAYNKFKEVVPCRSLRLAVGVILCFFGGAFPILIAAVESFFFFRGEDSIQKIKSMYCSAEEATAKKDDDANSDDAPHGSRTSLELAFSKMQVVFTATEPAKAQETLNGLLGCLLCVLCVLQVQFARALTLGAVIGSRVHELASSCTEMKLQAIVPEAHVNWIPLCGEWIIKGGIMFIAYMLMSIISVVHGAFRGSAILATELAAIEQIKKILPFKDDKGEIDAEKLKNFGFMLAIVGFLFQIFCGATVPWFFNIFLFPVQIVEFFVSCIFMV